MAIEHAGLFRRTCELARKRVGHVAKLVLLAAVGMSTASCSYLPFYDIFFNRPCEGCHDLSRSSFIKEMIFINKSPNTKCFDDYTPGSYHVKKLDLIAGVRELRDSTTRSVAAVIILGPSGPMWQYNVIAVIDSSEGGDSVAVNHLIFTHARIRSKSTRRVSREQYEIVMKRILTDTSLQEPKRDPKFSDSKWVITADDADEWNSFAAVALFSDSSTVRVAYDNPVQPGPAAERVCNRVNELLQTGKTKETYH